MSSAERVLSTPLPVGYNILISQIVLLYVYLLPFQLYASLGWVTIPGTIAAAYIIIGLAAIGNELENPFGNDVNDLPLDHYCTELGKELDIMMSMPMKKWGVILKEGESRNKVLWPLSEGAANEWSGRSEKDIRSALKAKVVVGTPLLSEKISNSRTGSKSGSVTTVTA
jgi:putative membrane protein